MAYCYHDLDIYLMTVTYKLDLDYSEKCLRVENEKSLSRCFQELEHDHRTQTDRHRDTQTRAKAVPRRI